LDAVPEGRGRGGGGGGGGSTPSREGDRKTSLWKSPFGGGPRLLWKNLEKKGEVVEDVYSLSGPWGKQPMRERHKGHKYILLPAVQKREEESNEKTLP